jgi:thiol-disulfide isomerase/thioredoxin
MCFVYLLGQDQERKLKEAEILVSASIKRGVAIDLDFSNIGAVLDGSSNLLIKVNVPRISQSLTSCLDYYVSLQFSTSWCGHCVTMAPECASLAQTIHKDYRGLKVVSVGKYHKIASYIGIFLIIISMISIKTITRS